MALPPDMEPTHWVCIRSTVLVLAERVVDISLNRRKLF